MQKVINVLAVTSFAVSAAVVGSGLYVFVNRASIVDGIKQQAIEAALGSLGSFGGLGGESPLPLGTEESPLPLGANDLPSSTTTPNFTSGSL